MEIYFDMDGVLADFAGRVKKLGLDMNDPEIRKTSQDEMWKLIQKDQGFWENLNPISDGIKLWNVLSKYTPNILSSGSHDYKRAKPGKKTWVKKNLSGYGRIIIVSNAKDKKYFAKDKNGEPNILIDDYKKNTDLWKKAGGIAVRFDPNNKSGELKKAIKELQSHNLDI